MTFAWQTFASLRLFTCLFTLARIACLLRQNKPFPLLYFGHAQIITVVWSLQFFEKIFTFVVLQKTAKKYQHVKYSFRRHVFS